MTASQKGFLLGFLGVALFALTAPVTKLATLTPTFPGLPPVFISFGRAAAAGMLAILYLLVIRAAWPSRVQAFRLILAGAGIVIGFPLFLGLAVQHVDSVHAAVISGALPLGTAALTALWMRERARPAFWALAVFGFLLVLLYAWLTGEGGFVAADGLLLLAVLSASCGYVLGARLSREMPPEHVISWILVLYLPLTIPVSALTWPQGEVAPVAWISFAYLAIVSMWLGFFAWYRGLQLGGALRVSQTQLAQPFLSMLAAAPLLGERITPLSLVFAAAIVATIAVSRRIR
ncbi:MAG: DMT family transporter [Beijerinckiaceae bacterium]|nr:DMT family transporter [Beijerinckiaceae bacterium]MCZ8299645.1 DMT family transporter [Beijerinckiaceae bacterium]